MAVSLAWQPELCREKVQAAGKRSFGNDIAIPGNRLRNAGTGQAENRDAVFRRPHGRDAGMKLVLVPAPILNVHCWDYQKLCPLFYQPVGDACVTQVVADADADFAPRRIPDVCSGAGRPSLKNWMGTLLTCLKTISPFVPTTKAVS